MIGHLKRKAKITVTCFSSIFITYGGFVGHLVFLCIPNINFRSCVIHLLDKQSKVFPQ